MLIVDSPQITETAVPDKIIFILF